MTTKLEAIKAIVAKATAPDTQSPIVFDDWGNSRGQDISEEVALLLAVAEAAAKLVKANTEYNEFSDKAMGAEDGVRFDLYNTMADERAMDMYRYSEELKHALAPLLEEAQ